ncbi:MAG: RNA methyltransferase, partial [Arenicellales bacterium]|nr:RNA methyltransferase [Arenicellales bacterium]
MTLEGIRIVLVNTTHPGNIGGAARAMANMGLNHLYLVGPQGFPSTEATVRAAGASHLLERAIVCESLDDAVGDCGLVVGTTARQRSVGSVELSPDAVMAKVRERILTDQIAFVFGREASGLTNSELERCQYHVRIPVEESFSSINLAAAVMIIVYELKKNCEPHTHETELASNHE